jgi:hypothetical protein
MSSAQELLVELCAIPRHTSRHRFPQEYTEKFIELAELYLASTEIERTSIRDSVSDDCRLLILGFSNRLAIMADRTANGRLLLLALVAHSIEDFGYDERENILRLALVDHVALKLKIRPTELFDRAIEVSAPRAAAGFQAFDARKPGMKSIRVMGLVEVTTPEGVDYQPIEASWPSRKKRRSG